MDLDMTVLCLIVACLLVLVLVMQIQLNAMSKEIDQKQESMSKKMDAVSLKAFAS
jgi:predicted Holliday junction resolvase-like endonuclease